MGIGPTAATTQTTATSTTPYEPPQGAQGKLGSLTGALRKAAPIETDSFKAHPAKFITVLPGGQVYFEVKTMDVDDDGTRAGSPAEWEPHPVRRGTDPKTKLKRDVVDRAHQDMTSYGAISAFEVPYVVMPTAWVKGRDLHPGMGAVVIRGDQLVYAVVGDFGPDKIGEMSIKAHQAFGETVVVDGFRAKRDGAGNPIPGDQPGSLQKEPAKVTRNSASAGPFLVIVFPKVRAAKPFKSVDESLRPALRQAWKDLTGVDVP